MQSVWTMPSPGGAASDLFPVARNMEVFMTECVLNDTTHTNEGGKLMTKRKVTNAEVHSVLNALGMDCGMEGFEFRVVRHYLRCGVPLCCISFFLFYHLPIQIAYLSEKQRPLEERPQLVVGVFNNHYTYQKLVSKLLPESPDYNLCPACVLSKNVVKVSFDPGFMDVEEDDLAPQSAPVGTATPCVIPADLSDL
jgi:hypothetical protein